MAQTVKVTIKGYPPFRVGPGPQRKTAVPKSKDAAIRLKEACEQELRRIGGVEQGYFRPWDITSGEYALTIEFTRKESQRDAANIIDEVANVLQGVLYQNDGQLTEIHYKEREGKEEEYTITVERSD